MAGHCYDFPGPRDQLVVATSRGWVPFDEQAARKLAESAMMLACGPEHLERLRRERLSRETQVVASTSV